MTLVSTGSDKFYIPASRYAFIKKVQAGLKQSKIVAMQGQQGIGKTVLIEEVLTLTSPDGNKCYLTAARSINDIQIRSRIIEQLFGNVLFDPEMPLLTSFIELNNQSEMLIAIDNAHYLSGKVIGELLQLYSEANTLGIEINIVLAFDKTVASTLMNVSSGFLDIYQVPVLTKQESYQLLTEYVADIPAQTNLKVKRWIDNSAGLPIQLLAYNSARASKTSDNDPFNIKLWGSILVTTSLLLSLGVYLYRIGIVSEQKNVGVDKENLTMPSEVVKPWKEKFDTELQNQNSAEQPQELVTGEKPMAKVVIRPTASSEQMFSELMKIKEIPAKNPIDEKVDKNPTTDLILAELIKPAQKAKAQSPEPPKTEEAEPQTTNNELTKAKVKRPNINKENAVDKPETPISMEFFEGGVDVENSVNVENNGNAQDDTTSGNNLTDTNSTLDISRIDDEPTLEELIKDDIISVAKEQPSAEVDSNPYNIDNQIFLSLPAEQFVLQLTAVSSEAVLAKYLQSIPFDKAQLRIYQVRRNQKDWIVVTYGLFETIEVARQTAASIAPNAWAKSVSVIQQQILAFNDVQSAQ